MMCVASLRATAISSHDMQTLFGNPEVNCGPEGDCGQEGMVIGRGIVVLRGIVIRWGTASRTSILWIDAFSFFFTLINKFVT